jgi:hypothetical protein
LIRFNSLGGITFRGSTAAELGAATKEKIAPYKKLISDNNIKAE